ncbi:homeobox domain-containing protein [Ditylenchus destructor]|nr:homeobox domain-containing protein [Ditylenchus destructor]
MNSSLPEGVQVMRITAPDGSVKELFFPKALDLSRPKRPRTTFSSEQLDRMEKEFLQNPYLVGKERRKLAADLGLSETQVKVWFQNRRTKKKSNQQPMLSVASEEETGKKSFLTHSKHSSNILMNSSAAVSLVPFPMSNTLYNALPLNLPTLVENPMEWFKSWSTYQSMIPYSK